MVVEIEGPSHYRYGTDEVMDSSLYNERIFKIYHKHFLRIPFKHFDKFYKEGTDKQIEEKTEFLRGLIETALKK